MSTTQKIITVQGTIGPSGIIRIAPQPNSRDAENDVHKVNYLWVIHDYDYCKRRFEKGVPYPSPMFSAATNTGCKWYLKFYPNGDSNKNSNCALYLNLDSSSKYKIVFGKFKVSILKENDTTMEACCKVSLVRKYELGAASGSEGWGFSNFIINESELLSDGRLMIYCEITFSVGLAFLSKNNFTEFRLSEDLREVYKNGEFTDVVLSVNGKEYRAHKLILTARSPVFANMFKHDVKESQENKVNITDFDEQVVEEMLNYMYTGVSENLNMMADKLLVAAEKYGLDELKDMSEVIMVENLSVENAIERLIFADLYQAHKLKSSAINYIVKKSMEVMQTKAWKNIAIAPLHPLLFAELCEAFSRQANDQKFFD